MCVCVLCESEQERQKKKQVELPYHCPLGFFFFLRFFLSAATQANLDTPPDHIQACRVVLSSKMYRLYSSRTAGCIPKQARVHRILVAFCFLSLHEKPAQHRRQATHGNVSTSLCLFVWIVCFFVTTMTTSSAILQSFFHSTQTTHKRERESERERERETDRQTEREREKRTHTHARIEANFLTLCCCLIDGWCVLVVQHRNFCCSQACCQARCSPACWQGMA